MPKKKILDIDRNGVAIPERLDQLVKDGKLIEIEPVKRWTCSKMNAHHKHRFKVVAKLCAFFSYVYNQQFFHRIKKRRKHIKSIIPGRKKKSGRGRITWR